MRNINRGCMEVETRERQEDEIYIIRERNIKRRCVDMVTID
jgi:hypothetical protein